MKEALLYEKLENQVVHCYLCSHHCRIKEGGFGLCGLRQNKAGVFYTHSFANPVAVAVDPIEKKPLYHFLPSSSSFSLACAGCNFRCGFCQNWQISQLKAKDIAQMPQKDVGPLEIVRSAIKSSSRSISYTYTEPTIFFEYAYEIAQIAKEKGLFNVFVTNGYMSQECLQMVKPYLDAANVDLKFFSDDSYRKICGARLKPVLDSIRLMHELGIWVEVTTLVVPGENDSEKELYGIANFLASIDKNMPWHVSGFHPDYNFVDHNPTPENTLKNAHRIGRECGLNYVYAGNVWGWGNDTYCHNCGKMIIKRQVFDVLEYNIKESKCAFCQNIVPGLFV